MIVVSDSSPLITLARIGQLDLLRQLFGHVHIADEVRQEVVVRGAGRPAAEAVRDAGWIQSHPAFPAAEMRRLRSLHPLGAGELATVLLARSLPADLAIIDERAARHWAQAGGLGVMGCVGILEPRNGSWAAAMAMPHARCAGSGDPAYSRVEPTTTSLAG